MCGVLLAACLCSLEHFYFRYIRSYMSNFPRTYMVTFKRITNDILKPPTLQLGSDICYCKQHLAVAAESICCLLKICCRKHLLPFKPPFNPTQLLLCPVSKSHPEKSKQEIRFTFALNFQSWPKIPMDGYEGRYKSRWRIAMRDDLPDTNNNLQEQGVKEGSSWLLCSCQSGQHFIMFFI